MAKKIKSESLKPGKVLKLQGDQDNSIYLLQAGEVEILSADDEFSGLNAKTIIENSFRVDSVKSQAYFFAIANKSIRACSAVTMQKLPVNPDQFSILAGQNPMQAITVLSQLFKRVETVSVQIAKYMKLYQNLSRVSDNIALMFKELSSQRLPENLEQRAFKYHDKFSLNNGQYPSVFDTGFLIADNGHYINRNYNLENASIDAVFNKELYSFFKQIFQVDKNILAHMTKANPAMIAYMFKTVYGYYVSVLDKIGVVNKQISQEMGLVFSGSKSWCEQLVDRGVLQEWERSGRVSGDFSKQLTLIISKIYAFYSDLYGKKAELIFPGLSKLQSYHSVSQKSAAAEAHAAGGAAAPLATNGAIAKLYKNSLQQIFQFALVDHDLQARFLKGLNEFKKMANPFTTETDARKIRRHLTSLYWDLYKQVFIRSKVERKVPAPVVLMLRYGFVDENMLDPGQLEVLHTYASQRTNTSIPILYEDEFLTKIYDEEETPSINEMGLTYEKYLRELDRLPSKKKKEMVDEGNEVMQKIAYEVSNRLASTTSVCSGSRSTAFPIFSSQMIKGDPAKLMFSKSKIEHVIRELIDTDYSVFYRETVLKLEHAREIIEEEIIPYFILLPTFGTKVMMWQELAGTNKRSRARIVIPVFFAGDIRKALAHAFAVFRWELSRTMKGGMWADPVEGGVTGAYYDYIQFFKKNSKISTDAKEKIAERLKGFRNNTRELFADDYIMWVTFERNGIMKMNSYVRDMFYRFVPFKRVLREKLEKMPAFRESANRFQNIRNRTIRNYERRYKKYMDDGGNLPGPIKNFMDYLNM